jgi:hypothetical protein
MGSAYDFGPHRIESRVSRKASPLSSVDGAWSMIPGVSPAELTRHVGNCADCGAPVDGKYRCPACTQLRARTRLSGASFKPPDQPPKEPGAWQKAVWFEMGARNAREYTRAQLGLVCGILAAVFAALIYFVIFGTGTVGQPQPAQQVANRLVTALANGDVTAAQKALCAKSETLSATALTPGHWRFLREVTTSTNQDQQFQFGLPSEQPTVIISVADDASDFCVDGVSTGP